MSQARLRTRRVRVDRVREVQGMLAIQELLSEAAPVPPVPTSSAGPKPRAGRTVDAPPLTYRKVLANWPDDWRERWGRRANDLEDSGLSWRDAEGRAFAEIYRQIRVRKNVERN